MSNPLMPTLQTRSQLVEAYLATCLNNFTFTPSLKQAMNYSLLAGGKRLRPVFCLTFAAAYGQELQRILPFAASLEMIHTYSLIHDDLPAMDNDDLRRGKPTCHKAFTEALAILAGDALLTDAFSLMLTTNITPATLLQAVRTVSLAAGGSGMVGGQVLDIDATAKNLTLSQLQTIHNLKTGAMLQASCLSGAILGGANPDQLTLIAEFGTALGTAFQIVDDILDITSDTATLGKPQGSDAKSDKATYPKFLGLEASQALAEAETKKALTALTALINLQQLNTTSVQSEWAFLEQLTIALTNRKY